MKRLINEGIEKALEDLKNNNCYTCHILEDHLPDYEVYYAPLFNDTDYDNYGSWLHKALNIGKTPPIELRATMIMLFGEWLLTEKL